jgi:hemoglobin
MPSPANQPSLYERLGGIYSIATVVDDLIDRVMNDPRLNANPAVNEAHHKVPPAGFKYLVTEMVGMASGGPQKYTGRPMRESHEQMNITPKEWEAFMDDLQQALDKFSVPAAEQARSPASSDCAHDFKKRVRERSSRAGDPSCKQDQSGNSGRMS